MTDCDASGNVTTTSYYYSYAGGIAGRNSGTLTNCDASGRVTASATGSYSAYAGGVIGYLFRYNFNMVISGNRFSSNTGQEWGIGYDPRETPPGPSNTGCTRY